MSKMRLKQHFIAWKNTALKLSSKTKKLNLHVSLRKLQKVRRIFLTWKNWSLEHKQRKVYDSQVLAKYHQKFNQRFFDSLKISYQNILKEEEIVKNSHEILGHKKMLRFFYVWLSWQREKKQEKRNSDKISMKNGLSIVKNAWKIWNDYYQDRKLKNSIARSYFLKNQKKKLKYIFYIWQDVVYNSLQKKERVQGNY